MIVLCSLLQTNNMSEQSVTLSLGDRMAEVSMKVVANSELLNNYVSDALTMSDLTGSQSDTDNVIIPLPAEYSFAFDDYLNFYQSQTSSLEQQIIRCLTFANYLQDNKYFEHTVQRLFDNWSTLSHIIYEDKVSHDVKYAVLLLCPYDLLPEVYRQDKIFIKQWLSSSDNVTRTIDGSKCCHINAPPPEETVNCQPLGSLPSGGKLLCSYYEGDVGTNYIYAIIPRDLADETASCYSLINLMEFRGHVRILYSLPQKRQGVWYVFNGNRISQKYSYQDNQRHGICETYHDDGVTISRRENYAKDRLQGVSEYFLANGVLCERRNYGEDSLSYTYEMYRDDGTTLRIKGKFYNDKRHCTYQAYFNDGVTVSMRENYVEGKLEGVSEYFHYDGSLNRRDTYDGKSKYSRHCEFFSPKGIKTAEGQMFQKLRVGVWQLYHDNDRVSGTGEYDSQNKKTGSWTEFGRNGKSHGTNTYKNGEKVTSSQK